MKRCSFYFFAFLIRISHPPPPSYWGSPQIIMADDIHLLCQIPNNIAQGWEKLDHPAWFGRKTLLNSLSAITAFHINIELLVDSLSVFFFSFNKVPFYLQTVKACIFVKGYITSAAIKVSGTLDVSFNNIQWPVYLRILLVYIIQLYTAASYFAFILKTFRYLCIIIDLVLLRFPRLRETLKSLIVWNIFPCMHLTLVLWIILFFTHSEANISVFILKILRNLCLEIEHLIRTLVMVSRPRVLFFLCYLLLHITFHLYTAILIHIANSKGWVDINPTKSHTQNVVLVLTLWKFVTTVCCVTLVHCLR
jgi:hypothetical protein